MTAQQLATTAYNSATSYDYISKSDSVLLKYVLSYMRVCVSIT